VTDAGGVIAQPLGELDAGGGVQHSNSVRFSV
jgi:hypothetical protein